MRDTIYMYIFDGLADWEVGYLSAELNRGEMLRPDAVSPQIVTISRDTKAIRTMGGLTVLPDITLSQVDLDKALALILPGGDSWLETDHQPILDLTERFLKEGILVGAICAATAALVKAGLVGNRQHTSNDLNWLKQVVTDYKKEENYQTQPAVTDDGLITANGSAPLEFTVHVLRALDLAKEETLEAWVQLNKTSDPQWFYRYLDTLD